MQSAQSLLAILAMDDAIPSASVSPAWGGMYRVVETVSVFRCEQPCDGAGRAVLRYGAFVPAATTPKSPHEWFQVIPSSSWRLWDSPHLVGTICVAMQRPHAGIVSFGFLLWSGLRACHDRVHGESTGGTGRCR